MTSTDQFSTADERFMRRALRLATQAFELEELPIAAVLVLEDRVVGEAHNLVSGENNLLAHAEMIVLQRAAREFPQLRIKQRNQLTLYSTLEPCMMCFGTIMALNVGRLCYALESPGDGVMPLVLSWQKKSEQLPFYKVPDTAQGLLRTESAGLFRDFSRRYPNNRFAKWTRQLSEVLNAPDRSGR